MGWDWLLLSIKGSVSSKRMEEDESLLDMLKTLIVVTLSKSRF